MRGSRQRRGERGASGASSIELVLYTPLLFFAIFATVQFALLYLGNQAASAAARETARIARVGGGTPDARQAAWQRGTAYVASVGKGVLEGATVTVTTVNGGDQVRATVQGRGQQVVPGLPAPRISQVVQGPVEQFRGDL